MTPLSPGPAAATLAAAFAGFDPGTLSSATRRHAALVLADTVGCMISGLADPEVARLADRMARHGPTEPFTGLKGSAQNLALVLGFAAAADELDEGHYQAGGHPAAPAAAAALAVAAAIGASDGARFAAFLVGYEVGARIGAASRLRPEAHPHGTWGTVGAAAAAAHLTGRDEVAFATILELAAGMGCATSVTAPINGGSIRSAWIGLSARNGLTALDLHDAGVTGEPGAIETTFGRVIGTAFDHARLAEGLGPRCEVSGGFLKRDASCRETHGALAAFRIACSRVAVEDIVQVDVATFADAARLSRIDPPNAMAARFSIPAVLAACARDGDVAADAFLGRRLGDLLSFAARVAVVEDPAATASQPAARRCLVTLRLRDGSTVEAMVESAPGDPSAPFDEAALGDKFVALLIRTGRTKADATMLFERLTAL